ncbi:MAG TPA: ankyrin repeat domain-containing protein [Sphingomonas sp.]|nr:ankyrin repeat domain-containing protein [Sphingomonas sp.]
MVSNRILGAIGLAGALALAMPAAAQLGGSDSYKFLQAVKDSKGQEVTDMLTTPGSTIVNTRDPSSGEGALHIVVKRGDPTWLRFLLQHGADPNLRDKGGVTPMLLAVNQDQEPCLQVLIDAHGNVDLANNRGETPLIRAVQMRDVAMVRDLLKAGANPDLADHVAGLSARDYAKRDTRSPIIGKLLADAPKAGAKAAVSGPQL